MARAEKRPGRLGGLAVAETLLDRIGGRTVAKHSLIDPKLVLDHITGNVTTFSALPRCRLFQARNLKLAVRFAPNFGR